MKNPIHTLKAYLDKPWETTAANPIERLKKLLIHPEVQQFLDERKKKAQADRHNRFHWTTHEELEFKKPEKEEASLHEEVAAKDGGTYSNPKGFSGSTKTDHKQFVKHAKSFDSEHKRVAGEYKSSSDDLNRKLRAKDHDLDTLHTTKAMDHITSHKITAPMTVYRGLKFKHFDPKKLKPGTTFTDHGYTSTSLDPETADEFADEKKTPYDKHGDAKNHVFRITLPKGTKAHYIDVPGKGFNHGHSSEQEVVLHRGTKFKISHHSAEGNRHIVHATVVGNEAQPISLNSKTLQKDVEKHSKHFHENLKDYKRAILEKDKYDKNDALDAMREAHDKLKLIKQAGGKVDDSIAQKFKDKDKLEPRDHYDFHAHQLERSAHRLSYAHPMDKKKIKAEAHKHIEKMLALGEKHGFKHSAKSHSHAKKVGYGE